jgi:hypothetical protein
MGELSNSSLGPMRKTKGLNLRQLSHVFDIQAEPSASSSAFLISKTQLIATLLIAHSAA